MYDAGLPYVHDNKPESDSESENDEKKSGKENLSMAKLASILKQIDEISDFISDSDPNVKRRAKVNQSLHNAVKCYKEIHDEKQVRRKMSDFLGQTWWLLLKLSVSQQFLLNPCRVWWVYLLILYLFRNKLEMDTSIRVRECPKVSLLGVDALWGDCTFIPADWGS